MSVRPTLAASLLLVLAGCGGGGRPESEVRLLAPAGVVGDIVPFERATGCRVDLRVYDEDEDVEAIAHRRDVDAVASPARRGQISHVSEELVRITVAEKLEITIPKRLAPAFDGNARPAGRRSLAWSIRSDGENETCAARWLAYATSQ